MQNFDIFYPSGPVMVRNWVKLKLVKLYRHFSRYNFEKLIRTLMNNKEKRLVNISTQTGVSNWLTVLPITEFGFESSKQQIWDSMRLRYGLKICNLPTSCSCGSKFDIQYSMSCKNVAS